MLIEYRMELAFIALFAYLRKVRQQQLAKVVDSAASKAKTSLPVVTK